LKNSYNNIHQELINKCKAGNSEAQFEIYKLYYKAMYNTCLRIVNNVEDAEDIMQDAFLASFNKINTYKGEVSYGAWLKKIVINKSLDYLKKNKIEFVTEEHMANIAAEDEEKVYVENEVSLQKIKKAINKLPEGYNLILTLYLLEGYDHNEISQILGITSTTSRTQFFRAKKKLKEILLTI